MPNSIVRSGSILLLSRAHRDPLADDVRPRSSWLWSALSTTTELLSAPWSVPRARCRSYDVRTCSTSCGTSSGCSCCRIVRTTTAVINVGSGRWNEQQERQGLRTLLLCNGLSLSCMLVLQPDMWSSCLLLGEYVTLYTCLCSLLASGRSSHR